MSAGEAAPPIPTQPYEMFLKQQRELERQDNDCDDVDDDDRLGGASAHDRADRTMQFGRLGDLDTNSFHAASIDTPLTSNNPGFRMLMKMGWKTGQGLGSKGQGRVDPVALAPACNKLGLVSGHSSFTASSISLRLQRTLVGIFSLCSAQKNSESVSFTFFVSVQSVSSPTLGQHGHTSTRTMSVRLTALIALPRSAAALLRCCCDRVVQGKLEADLGKARDATETRRLLQSEMLQQ
jgi:hypothetical protein